MSGTGVGPTLAQEIAERQASEMSDRYGAAAWAEHGRIYIAASDWARLRGLVFADPDLNAVGRGWFLDGNRNVTVLPECDRCGVLLLNHGITVTGQACDLSLAISSLTRAVLGERWWGLYDRRRL